MDPMPLCLLQSDKFCAADVIYTLLDKKEKKEMISKIITSNNRKTGMNVVALVNRF